MIDFHCHVDLYTEPREVLAGIARNRCFVIAVTTTPLAWEGTTALIGNTPGVHIAAGLHPELVASRHKEVDLLCDLISKTNYVGEVGLDLKEGSEIEKQKKRFGRFVELSGKLGKPLIVHSRKAEKEAVELLDVGVEVVC